MDVVPLKVVAATTGSGRFGDLPSPVSLGEFNRQVKEKDGKDLEVSRDGETLPSLEPSQTLPGHLPSLIYTSGSTGRPKAVAIEHRSAAALAGWARETFSGEELSGVVAATSVCFAIIPLLA